MLKKNKTIIIVTTLISLLPILVGLILWNQLPDQIPTHWGIDGQVDGWSNKGFAVFVLPSILTAVHLLCVFASVLDPKHHVYEGKMLHLVLWICPVLSLVLSSLMYTVALGHDIVNIPVIMCLLVGIMFVIFGNYLPKCQHNYTMGIKLPWTFADEGNWNATHRFGGWVWVICGAVMMATSFLGNFWLLLALLIVSVIAPTAYSYLYYRKHKKGTA